MPKTWHKTDFRKDPCLESETRSRVTPSWTSAGKICIGGLKFFAALHMSVNNCERTVSIDFRAAHKFYQVGEFANMDTEIIRFNLICP